MLSKTKISRKFSTVIPSKIRKEMGLDSGDVLTWRVKDDKIELTPRKKTELKDITGLISAGGDAVISKKDIQRGAR